MHKGRVFAIAVAITGLVFMPAARAGHELEIEIEDADQGHVIINSHPGLIIKGDDRMIEQYVEVRPAQTTTVLSAPAPAAEVSQTTLVQTAAPAADTTVVATFEDVRDLSEARPYFCDRIENMRSWLDEGVSKGFLSADQASSYKAEVDRIDAMIPNVLDPNADLAKSDEIEKALNLLNISVADSMSGTHVASGGQLQ